MSNGLFSRRCTLHLSKADSSARTRDVKSVPMRVKDTDVLVCDCGDTMTIDAKALARGCGSTGECSPATSLPHQTDRPASAMAAAADGRNILVTCTQEIVHSPRSRRKSQRRYHRPSTSGKWLAGLMRGQQHSQNAPDADALTVQPPARSMGWSRRADA